MSGYRHIGRETPRPDASAKATGKALYIQDLKRPGMPGVFDPWEAMEDGAPPVWQGLGAPGREWEFLAAASRLREAALSFALATRSEAGRLRRASILHEIGCSRAPSHKELPASSLAPVLGELYTRIHGKLCQMGSPHAHRRR